MEVEEENTSNHLEESMAGETTTVINESLLEDTTNTDKESEKERTKSIPESNNREEEDASVFVTESEDSKAVALEVDEKVEDERAEEVDIRFRNSESVAALSGGIENSVVVESVMNVVEDSKDGGDGAVKEVDVPSDGVAAVECGDVSGGDVEEAVVDRNGDLEMVVDTNVGGVSVIEKDENEGAEEILKDVKGDDAIDQLKNVQLEDVANVHEMVGYDVRNDGVDFEPENIVNVEEDETLIEEVVAEVVKEEEIVAEAVNEEEIVAEVVKEEVIVAEVVKEEEIVAEAVNEEEIVAEAVNEEETVAEAVNEEEIVAEAVKEEIIVAEAVNEEEIVAEVNEEELVAEAVKEEEIVAEAVNEEEIVAEAAKEEEIVAEAVKEEEIVAEVVKEEEIVAEVVKEEEAVAEVVKEGVDAEVIKEEEIVTEVVREDFKQEETMAENVEKIDGVAEHVEEETMMEDEEKSLDTEKYLDAEAETEKSFDNKMETEKSLETEMENEKSLDTEMETEKSLDTKMENEEEENLADEEKAQEEEEEEIETEPEPSKKSSGAKRKRGGKAAPKKPIDEDVCFICFDGGDLVLCDRRNCPKAYHASCVNRDPAFFQSKGSWNCGWHLCSYCEKKAEYMCYTCTYSLCRACTKSQVILCVREKEKKGLCEPCMKTVMSIEKQEEQGNVNPEDKDSWEHLFKDYWVETKEKHNLSLDELVQAKNPSKGSGKQKSSISHSDDNSDNPPETLRSRKSKRNTKKQKYTNKEDEGVPENADWVSNELLEFVMHMRNGDSSVISQFEVQDLLLEYIKRNKLRDPNRKSQIICDARLKNLFGKPRVAHIEMLKLLESHFLVKEEIDDVQGSVVDTEVSPLDKKRKGRKRGDKRGGPQSNREDYAAIDVHNINLIYLRRKLVEDLLDDMETFHDKIVATFVRIRVSGVNQKQDIYRLVQVKGTSEGARYTLSKRTTCTMLEILNLDKTETISIDSISNQDFMEEECKRLRQSIKFGFISRLTVGDVLDKAMELQAARVNDWLETEVTRLNHLRDRASDMGRKKELRECVEKLNLLKTPEERARRLEEIPLVHDDATMDPEYESDDDTDSDDKKQELYRRSDSYRFNKRGRDEFSPRGDYSSKESWSGGTSSSKNYEFSRNLSFNKNFSTKLEATSKPEIHVRDHERKTSFVPQPQPQIIVEKPNVVPVSGPPKVDETEKMWHYKDPSDKIQGPFSMVQLRKWNKNGYFPAGLKIWRKTDKEDDAILLSDALDGKYPNFDQSQQQLRNLNPNLKPAPDSRLAVSNLPSPTAYKATSAYPSGNEGLQSPTPHLAGPSLVPCVNRDGGSVSVAQPLDTTGMAAPPQMVQGWGGAVPPSMNVAVPQQQQMAYGQWPNMVQNPVGVGNYMQMPQEQWGQFPFPVNQPNMPFQPPNMQQHMSWGTMAPTPNMGWVAPNTGAPMNWGPQQPMVQGGPQMADPAWVQNWPMVAGYGNSGWVGGTQVAPPANAGWVGGPPVNQGAPPPVANNMGWVPPAGNQGAPPPAQQPPSAIQSQGGNNNNSNRNHGWGGNESQRRSRGGGSGSGFRGGGGSNRRNYNQEPHQKEGGE